MIHIKLKNGTVYIAQHIPFAEDRIEILDRKTDKFVTVMLADISSMESKQDYVLS